MTKRFCIAIVATLVILFLISYLPVHGEEAVYDTVVRLHVLANSDSEEDQALKLRVRDAV
jgi:stage II sporulation protein R